MNSNADREILRKENGEDRAYKESTAVQIKTWGDALRNTITKMPRKALMWYRGLSVLTNYSNS